MLKAWQPEEEIGRKPKEWRSPRDPFFAHFLKVKTTKNGALEAFDTCSLFCVLDSFPEAPLTSGRFRFWQQRTWTRAPFCSTTLLDMKPLPCGLSTQGGQPYRWKHFATLHRDSSRRTFGRQASWVLWCLIEAYVWAWQWHNVFTEVASWFCA